MKNIITVIIILSSLNTLLSQNIERYKIHHDSARNLILKGKYQKAVLELDKAINIMPYYHAIYKDRAYANMQLKQYHKALIDIDIVLSKKAYLTEVKLQKAIALFHLKQINQAENLFIDILKEHPEGNKEADIYLNIIAQEYMLIEQNRSEIEINKINTLAENNRIKRAKHRESIILNTVIPLALWTSLFIYW